MTKSANRGSLAGSTKLQKTSDDKPQAAPKGRPADTSHKVQIDPSNPGRHILRSKASERAQAARDRLKKLNKSTLKDLSDEEASQMAADLGLRIMRGTGASGDVTRGDYLAALEGLLPVPVAKKGQA
jgi:hypothetical protein